MPVTNLIENKINSVRPKPNLFVDYRSIFTTVEPEVCKTYGKDTLDFAPSGNNYSNKKYFAPHLLTLLPNFYHCHLLVQNTVMKLGGQQDYKGMMNDRIQDKVAEWSNKWITHPVISHHTREAMNYIDEYTKNDSMDLTLIFGINNTPIVDLLELNRAIGGNSLGIITGMMDGLTNSDIDMLESFSKDPQAWTKEVEQESSYSQTVHHDPYGSYGWEVN